MEISSNQAAPHPHLLEALFAFRSKIARVFNDIYGLYGINHLAITRVNRDKQFLIFSATPAIEFNLFSGKLWRHDKTYHLNWFQRCSQASWQTLYDSERYDELYYLKQIKHRYPIGSTLAAASADTFFIYSFASKRACSQTREFFANQYDDFYKIGQYCTNSLLPLFMHSENAFSLEQG